MKKLVLLAAIMMAAIFQVSAQSGVYESTNPLFTHSGAFRQPSTYRPVSANGTRQQFPWYTRRDTVTNTAADTFVHTISSRAASVYTWAYATQISGTNTSCTVRLQASADSGAGVAWVTLYTNTVTATNPVGYHLVNDGKGWPYRVIRWIYTGVGTHSTWWYCGLLIR